MKWKSVFRLMNDSSDYKIGNDFRNFDMRPISLFLMR
ncbi:putative coupling protein [Staphylococcus aureus]|uniref:Putative coupling protein n=1 Tax=Staphylococcus aureus TaxID=1280 RepID=A0A8G2I0R6_STAAU|nr:putative coupling protein [Staphylococcus aureus]